MNPRCLCRLVALSSLAVLSAAFAAEDYQLGTDSMPREGVPRGDVMKYHWSSQIFPALNVTTGFICRSNTTRANLLA
jgi:hypothetical protein